MSVQADQERHSFQAEVVQILDLMIHSLYSNKEIFLRELISNASDAIDRLRFEIFTRPELDEDEGPLQIQVSFDPAARTVTVTDNGIGMSRAEVMENIGTIAKSGTSEFLQALTGDQRKDATLIGQFGVGFYSAFVVADRVTLTTRRAGLPAAEGVRWESDGTGEYALETVDRPARGTEIVLHLRDTEDDLLNGFRLRTIIQKYSDHISLPIMMPAQRPDGEAGDGEGEGEDACRPPRSTRPRRCGPGPRTRSPSRTTTSSTSTPGATSPTRWPTCTARSRAATSTRCCCSSRPGRPGTCGHRTPDAASSCTSGGSSSWRTTASCCPGTCGSSAASSTPATCR